MEANHPTLGEKDSFYRQYDNDSLYIYLRKALFALSVLFLLCFILWPLGLYKSRDWPSAPLARESIQHEYGVEKLVGYRVHDVFHEVRRWYFGGNPPRLVGGPYKLKKNSAVYYNPADPSDHVVHRSPSWLTLLLPLLALGSVLYARRLKRSISENGPKNAHPSRN